MEHADRAVAISGCGVDRHEGRESRTALRSEGRREREDRLLLSWHLQRQVVRRLELLDRLRRIEGHDPEVGAVVEGRGVRDVVARHDHPLHLEEVLRVAHVCLDGRRHGTAGLDNSGECLHPGLEDGIGLVPGIEGDGALIGIDHGLDGVARVVELVIGRDGGGTGAHRNGIARDFTEGDSRRVGIIVRGRVAVDQPHDATVHDRRIGVLVEGEPRRDLLDAGERVTVPEDARLLIDEVGEQDVGVLEFRREEKSMEEPAHRHATVAGVCVVDLARRARVVGIVELDRRGALRRADDGEGGRELAEVDARLLDPEEPLRRDVALEEVRLARGFRGVVIGRDEPVAVRVDSVVVCPVALVIGDSGEIDLTGGDDGAALTPLQGVAIHVEAVVEGVVRADLLELVVRRRRKRGVEQADVVKRAEIGLDHRLVRRLHRARVFLDLRVRDVVGGAGRRDVALDVGLLADELARTHLELLHDRRVDTAHEDRCEDEEPQADQRDDPVAHDHVDDEEHGGDEGHEGEDLQRGEHGIGIRVLHAGEALDERLALDHEPETIEPVGHRLEQQEQRDEPRQVDLGRRAHAIALRLQAQAAVEIVRRDGEADREDDDREGKAEDEAQEGIGEGVEADVEPELRIRDAEFGRIAPLQEGAPLSGG